MANKKKAEEKPRASVTNWCVSLDQINRFLSSPKDASSLAVTRILFGLLMLLDIPLERGFSEIDHRFGDPRTCHFPLFDFVRPLSFPLMSLVYALMWLGAFGMMIGYRYRLSCLSFFIPYLYVFLLDKTAWNNHSYLYGLLAILLTSSSANHFCSVDAWLDPSIRNRPVPNWNYLLLRFQIFLLYFFAGIKKFDQEWLSGYPMKYIGKHYVFTPFRLLLTDDNIEYYIVHYGGFVLDLTIGFWLLWSKSRPYAIFFGSSFHMMNSRLFAIGMFPYMCLSTMPLFCDADWPKRWIRKAPSILQSILPSPDAIQQSAADTKHQPGRFKLFLIASYVSVQLLLPWSHGLTQGYNNWTQGLYGYSWDMMVHGWTTMHVVVTVEHKLTGRISYLDTESADWSWPNFDETRGQTANTDVLELPSSDCHCLVCFIDRQAFVKNDKWVGHVDMVHQYAHCVKERLETINITDIAIFVDVWRSLNGRFHQRSIDPGVDILSADWSPFRPTAWLMPLLTELTPWRQKMIDLEEKVLSESQSARVAFFADFPGLVMENWIPADVANASLYVLDGQVDVSFENGSRLSLKTNETAILPTDGTHVVHTRSSKPACYMYTYMGLRADNETTTQNDIQDNDSVWLDLWSPYKKSIGLVSQSILSLVFGIPLVPLA